MVDEDKKPLSDYKPAIIFGVGGFVIILTLVFAIGWPLVKTMNKTKEEVQAKRAELADLENRLTILQGLESKRDELTKQNEKVLAALPEDSDVSRLFIQLEKIANENGLSIQSVSRSGEAVSSSGSLLTPVTYNLTGSAKNYSLLKTALGKIESALRVVSVSKADINDAENSLGVNLSVITYVRGGTK